MHQIKRGNQFDAGQRTLSEPGGQQALECITFGEETLL